MKTSNMHRALSAALIGLALAVMTQIGYAANEIRVAALTDAGQTTPANASAQSSRAERGSPLTLYVEDPSGNAFRLVRIEGSGWKYADGWKSSDRASDSPFRKMAFGSTASAPVAKETVMDEEPLTVFIDGPSGFTFVWDREGGWKFVGKISDKRP